MTITINIVLFSIVFMIFDFLCFKVEYNKAKKINPAISENYNKIAVPFETLYNRLIKNNELRQPEGLNFSKKPIVIFGCSYGYGWGLKAKQSFSHKLSNYSSRPVYNKSIPGTGIQYMLYQLKRDYFYKEINPPEYIIYVLIDNHVFRLFRYSFGTIDKEIDVRYKEQLDGSLTEIKPNFMFFRGFCLVKVIQNFIAENRYLNENNRDKNFDFMKLHFMESKKIIDKKFPDTKFVILKYNDTPNSWYLNTKRWKELEDEGFIVLDSNELTGKSLSSKRYKLDDGHPNEEAWNEIVPAITKQLGL